jgi:cytochrome c biogenesis protein CcmG/thiol:disulfide interchange protein DsbE
VSRPGRVAVVLLVGVLLVGCVPEAPEPQQPVEAPQSGGRLPDVRLDALRGEGSLDLGELRGPAVVNLWASWCPPCREELPYYQAFAEEYAGTVEVIGIDFEETNPSRAIALADEAGLTYPLYADPEGELRAVVLPQLVLVDEAGEIAFEQYLEIEGPEQLAELAREHLGVA